VTSKSGLEVILDIFYVEKSAALKSGSGVTNGHRNYYH